VLVVCIYLSIYLSIYYVSIVGFNVLPLDTVWMWFNCHCDDDGMFCQETTAHEVVMLALREFGSSESSRSV